MDTGLLTLDELVALVDVDPVQALETSTARLGGAAPPDIEAAQLWWVSGLAHRELGHLAAAHAALDRSRDLALDSGDRGLAARVTISLAFEIGHEGDIGAALTLLSGVEADAKGSDLARLAGQRGILHYRLGRLDAAVHDLDQSHRIAGAAGDGLTQLKALVNLGAIQSQRATYVDARRHLMTAITLAAELDQVSWGALALANLAFVETVEGNLPEALDCFASAEEGYRIAGSKAELPRLHADHALALAEANLLGDAEELIDRAIEVSSASGNDVEVAELLLVSAEIDLARGAADEARQSAADAGRRFAQQGRDSWSHVSDRLRLRAEARLAPDDPAVADQLVENGRALAASGWRSEALAAELLAALLHARAGRDRQATELLTEVAADVGRSRATDRIVLGHVVALLEEHRGDRAAARRAVTAGLRVAAVSQAALGSLETRSHAAHHGADLIELGARLAVADRRPRELLHRIEAMRTMVWHAPVVRPPDDVAMATQLCELRRLNALIADPDSSIDARTDAEPQRLRVEMAIRGLARRARGSVSGALATTEQAVAAAVSDLRALGDRQALAYANLGGRLLAVSVDRGRCRLHDLGLVGALTADIETCGFVLHRLNRAQGSEASRAAARQSLCDATNALGARLLPASIVGSDRPLVVIPTGVLHGVPWTALSALCGRSVSVSPSLSGWSVAARASAVRTGRRVDTGQRPGEPAGFVAGPNLQFADVEVRSFAGAYRRSSVLTGADATADRCLELLGTSELVHLACHGSFRGDNPLFSTLSLADGPLTVYDLERVETMPEIVILSACSVGSSAAINGGTLLGLASALGVYGASTVIAPLTPVSDERVVPVMQRIHRGLAGGVAPAAALATAAYDDGELDATAAAFVAIGA